MLAGHEGSEKVKWHLKFTRRNKPKGKKTNIYNVIKVMTDRADEHLGLIKWHGACRQYVHWPDNDTCWSKTCNELVNNFLDKANKRHRDKWRKRRKLR